MVHSLVAILAFFSSPVTCVLSSAFRYPDIAKTPWWKAFQNQETRAIMPLCRLFAANVLIPQAALALSSYQGME